MFVVGVGATLGWSTIVVAGVEIVESLGEGAWWWRGDVSSHDFSRAQCSVLLFVIC